jgi:hypothetical protein
LCSVVTYSNCLLFADDVKLCREIEIPLWHLDTPIRYT